MKPNSQEIVKQNLHPEGHLVVHSIFYTIQGEGPFAGRPALFIRLSDCNLQCPGCDTEYTSTRKTMTPAEILEEVRKSVKPRTLVVITGGEPFRQNIAPLVRVLASYDYIVQIETNGTLFVPGLPWSSVTVVCSPKTGRVNQSLLDVIDAYKYVLHADSVDDDGLPIQALDHSVGTRVARPHEGFKGSVYLQPMDCHNTAQNHRNIAAVRDSCLKHGYTLQLQIHKIIGVE